MVYTVSSDFFQTWGMAYPTKNFVFTVRFPEDMVMQIDSMLSDMDLLERIQENGYTKIIYDSWVLPGGALAWRIFPKARNSG